LRLSHRSLKFFAKNENYFPLWEQKRPYFGMVAQSAKSLQPLGMSVSPKEGNLIIF